MKIIQSTFWVFLSVATVAAKQAPILPSALPPEPPKKMISLQELLSKLRAPKKAPIVVNGPSPVGPTKPFDAELLELSKQADPCKMVKLAYETIVKKNVWTNPGLCTQLFEPAASKAIAAQMNRLRFDPLLCAQMLPTSMGNVTTNHLTKTTAGCAATLYLGPNNTNPHTIKIHLKKIGGLWKIHDIHHRDTYCPGGICSVRKVLGLKG